MELRIVLKERKNKMTLNKSDVYRLQSIHTLYTLTITINQRNDQIICTDQSKHTLHMCTDCIVNRSNGILTEKIKFDKQAISLNFINEILSWSYSIIFIIQSEHKVSNSSSNNQIYADLLIFFLPQFD